MSGNPHRLRSHGASSRPRSNSPGKKPKSTTDTPLGSKNVSLFKPGPEVYPPAFPAVAEPPAASYAHLPATHPLRTGVDPRVTYDLLIRMKLYKEAEQWAKEYLEIPGLKGGVRRRSTRRSRRGGRKGTRRRH